MSPQIARRLFATVLTFAALVALGSGPAYAKVAPDGPEFVTPPTTMTVTTTDLAQLGLVAAVAALVGIAATIAVLLVIRHSHRSADRARLSCARTEAEPGTRGRPRPARGRPGQPLRPGALGLGSGRDVLTRTAGPRWDHPLEPLGREELQAQVRRQPLEGRPARRAQPSRAPVPAGAAPCR